MLVVPRAGLLKAPESLLKATAGKLEANLVSLPTAEVKPRIATAIVYCEANFGEIDG